MHVIMEFVWVLYILYLSDKVRLCFHMQIKVLRV